MTWLSFHGMRLQNFSWEISFYLEEKDKPKCFIYVFPLSPSLPPFLLSMFPFLLISLNLFLSSSPLFPFPPSLSLPQGVCVPAPEAAVRLPECKEEWGDEKRPVLLWRPHDPHPLTACLAPAHTGSRVRDTHTLTHTQSKAYTCTIIDKYRTYKLPTLRDNEMQVVLIMIM